MKSYVKKLSLLALLLLFTPTLYANSELISALQKGDTQTAQNLITNGAKINGKDEKIIALLSGAIYNENFKIIRFLIQNGVDANTVINSKYDRDNSTSVIKVVETCNTDMSWGQDFALKTIPFLIQNGANITYTNVQKKTALSIAGERGCDDIVALLKKHGLGNECQKITQASHDFDQSFSGKNYTQAYNELFSVVDKNAANCVEESALAYEKLTKAAVKLKDAKKCLTSYVIENFAALIDRVGTEPFEQCLALEGGMTLAEEIWCRDSDYCLDWNGAVEGAR
jgi:ankyrin repeat protein